MEEIKQNIAAKSTIVDQAKKLLDADNFRNARNELDKLKDSLREIGSAGSAKDDEFHVHWKAIILLRRPRRSLPRSAMIQKQILEILPVLYSAPMVQATMCLGMKRMH